MKRFNLSAWAVSHPTLVLFLMLVLGVAGFFSYQKLGRAEDPFFTVKVVNVSVLWPGATAQEMQAQVADPIEKKIQELPYFEKVQTYSKPGFTALQVTFRDSTPPKDVPYLFYLLRKKLADVQGQLPAGILGPVVNDEFSDVDSILYMMTGDGADYAQLKKVSEGFRQRLLKVPGVTKVDVYGNQDERIFVEFSHAKLATLGITPQALFDSLAKQNNVTPAGTVETSSQRVPLRVTGALDGAKAVAETPVESNGRVFRLGDIATVTHGYVDPPSFVVRQEGKSAIGIGVVTAKGANILDLGKEVEKATAEFMKAVPQGVDVKLIADQPKVVEHAVGEFVHSFMEALVIVLFVSFLALGWRTGIVVALSVPLVLGIVFIVMNTMSLDLHRITLGALIIALGLLVDDAIIAVEMMVVKMEQGWDRMRAASFAWESTAFPMLTGTLVTAAGFLPIGFANSAVGEYAGSIFWIVAIALVASWFVAVIFTPYIGVMLLPNIKVHHNHDPHAVYETRMYRGLRAIVQWCVNHRITVVVATVGVFIASIVGFGHVQQQFFPLSERPELFLQLRLPEGTAFNVTEKAVKKAETLLKDDKDIDDLYVLCRPGFAALLARPQPAAAERGLCRDRHRRQGRRGARAGQGQDRGCRCRRHADRGARARRPLQFRSAGRLPRAVPRDRPRRQQGARDRLPGSRRHAAEQERQGRPARLERAVALPQARRRPGSRPRHGSHPAGRLAGAVHADLRRAGHDRARRHREGRRGRPCGRLRTSRPRRRRRSHHHLEERRCRAAAADRQDRICPRGTDHVAA